MPLALGPDALAPVTLDRREGPYGEVVLRRRGEDFEIIANGCFLMDTSDGRSERLLIDAALDALPADRPAPAVLIGGLGVGFSLARAAAGPRWGRIAVAEREQAIVDWHLDGPLAGISGAALADPRTVVLTTDLVAYLRTTTDRYDALCLDIDNGPDWTVTEDNGNLYSPPDSPTATRGSRRAACSRCGPHSRPRRSNRPCGMPDSVGLGRKK